MPTVLLTVPLPTPISDAEAITRSSRLESSNGQLTLEYLDSNGHRIGQSWQLPMPPLVAVETPGLNGKLNWQNTRPPLALRDEPPSAAASLHVHAPGGFEAEVPLESANAPRAPDALRVFGKEGSAWMLAVVAERFNDHAAFFNH